MIERGQRGGDRLRAGDAARSRLPPAQLLERLADLGRLEQVADAARRARGAAKPGSASSAASAASRDVTRLPRASPTAAAPAPRRDPARTTASSAALSVSLPKPAPWRASTTRPAMRAASAFARAKSASARDTPKVGQHAPLDRRDRTSAAAPDTPRALAIAVASGMRSNMSASAADFACAPPARRAAAPRRAPAGSDAAESAANSALRAPVPQQQRQRLRRGSLVLAFLEQRRQQAGEQHGLRAIGERDQRRRVELVREQTCARMLRRAARNRIHRRARRAPPRIAASSSTGADRSARPVR